MYLGKFKARLSPKNALHLRRLVLFLAAMDKFCQDKLGQANQASNKDEIFGVAAFVDALGPKVREVNLLEVDKYLRESKIARKVCAQLLGHISSLGVH